MINRKQDVVIHQKNIFFEKSLFRLILRTLRIKNRLGILDERFFMHQSIPSANIRLGKPLGNFFEVVKSPAPGQNFPAKARPPGIKTPTPGEYFRRSSQTFLLTGVEILGFCRNQSLKRIGRLSNYSLVIPSSFSLSTILKVSPSFETDFVTREQQ